VYANLGKFFSGLEKQVVTVRIEDVDIQKADPNRMLRFLKPYQESGNIAVRSFAYKFEAKTARLHPAGPLREEVAERLVAALVSADEIDRELHNTYSQLLLDGFKGQDFSKDAKDAILTALKENNPRPGVIAASGAAQMTEALPRLGELLIDEVELSRKPSGGVSKWYFTVGWHARLARARIGVKEDVQKCVELVRKVSDTQALLSLLEDVAYIRQPEAIQCLQRYLEGNLRFPSTNPGAKGEPVASYVVDLLADSLQGFPVEKKRERFYSDEDIERAREWMKQQKTWNIIR
jgi:hypothetical protein